MYYEDFRKCSLKLEESELRQNVRIYDVKKFQRPLSTLYDVDEYLWRQFHILREDCFYHLKETIKSIRLNNVKTVGNLSKDCGLWRYINVKFNDISIGLFDIAYEIKFETVGRVDWADTKQLRFGSLLCLSCDSFRSYFLATVTDSDIKDLKRGFVKIHLMDTPLIREIDRSKKFQMLETQAYYESYVHILGRLKTLNDASFPFIDVFLKGKTQIGTIKYLYKKPTVISSRHLMDESQKSAFKTALTDPVSIIQGPPGTGKTTVGFWIVEKLLKKYKDKYNLTEPILVVCYTNHALDQFLEKIRAICEQGEVIRIGSKSDSEKLKSSNIVEFVNEWKTNKKFPKYMAVRRAQLRVELNELKSGILDEDTSESTKLSKAIEYERVLSEFRKCGMDEHLMLMRTSKVIGMTTTACARYADVLSELGCKIVIIEEAAELLEAHVICSLNNFCQQLIMIGDHQQLQPTATVREFEDVYDLNISLFERLIKNGFPHVTLTCQRRMRPEISRCISPIYPNLTDHASVRNFPNVVGMRTNMYIYDHSCSESAIFETSYKNLFEVSFVKGLCDYLLNCGVSSEKITIITTYRGQRYCIKKALKEEKFKEVSVFVVDAYQGEENDVIILSLVRSNFGGNIGFLKTPNRICVALSRARYGFYIVGNMTCLKSRSALWSSISGILAINVGTKLPVTCQLNSKHKPIIEEVDEFYNEKRCKDICDVMFPCGEHSCRETCHSGDHKNCAVFVEKQCQRKVHKIRKICSAKLECFILMRTKLPCGHHCEHACDDLKLKCIEQVEVVLNCTHKQAAICGTAANDMVCNKRYSQTLQCGHTYVDCNIYTKNCDHDVTYTRKCNHSKTIKCYQRELEDTLECDRILAQTLPCGHIYIDCIIYTGLCYRERALARPCGHEKTIMCHEWLEESKQKCQQKVTITLSCGHEEIVICGTKSGDIECSKRYSQVLNCGHPYIDCLCYTGDCHTIVRKKMPCGHVKEVGCFEKDLKHECVEKCSNMLSCGHICLSKCKDCFDGRLHVACEVMCKGKLFCGHHCKSRCHSGDCVGCIKDCWITSVKKVFEVKVNVRRPIEKWIHLSKSLHKRAMDEEFENIIQRMVNLKKLSDAELRNLSLAYICYEKVVNFANGMFNANDIQNDLIDYISYIESVVHHLFRWLNPFNRDITKDCVEQLDLELFRLKDMFAVCLHIQLNNTDGKLKLLLDELKDAVYNSEIKEHLRRKIACHM